MADVDVYAGDRSGLAYILKGHQAYESGKFGFAPVVTWSEGLTRFFTQRSQEPNSAFFPDVDQHADLPRKNHVVSNAVCKVTGRNGLN